MDALTTTIMDEIRQANKTFEKTFGLGDGAGMARLYTSDGMLLPTGSEPVQGHEGIAAFWQGAMQMGIKEANLRSVEVEQLNEDTAIEMGNYHLYGMNHQVLDQGKYMVVWKHEGNNWKLHRDIWNSSQGA
ncbi:SgcJ/EcaC family oxidoreductase [Hymenobacter taeanensis]|uniref:SgcJ/EcaC family oxidoreductase n=1 Tax=Hymenobacter taeanensis TaxID=2735321 RepID=A0A6M6BBQ6_9BACT|nr:MULTISPECIES: SgcJ/EcaC family oxidoreductase [Hymenobacter]QJX45831.1 SgcJ/EcaC family oxidoreductase [Hymenobacter taeanensis]UOQ79674.1 SgcJ/EcaC family oxidoreductase [Hymenobacter sp. 5414T-23]